MHTLPTLPYAYDALEPYIDAKTMEIHYTKHHQAYIDKLNAALEKYPELQALSVEDLLRSWNTLTIPDADKTAIRNHGGGHANHSLFWKLMDPKNVKDETLVADITTTFNSVDEFKKQFNDLATKLFGSGWVWLYRESAGALKLGSFPLQDSPFLSGNTPVLGLDVWEHAYYLKYQNKRAEYIEQWWGTIKLV